MHSEHFNVGDRIVMIDPYYGKVGDEGYVFGYSLITKSPFVVFDRPQGHSGNSCLDRPNPQKLQGWFISRNYMKVLSSTPLISEPDADDII